MSELDTTLYAGWAIKSIKQDFETLYDTYVSKYYRENLVMFDYDYELTDKSSHSGKISAHRIGNDYLNAAFQAISADLGCMLSVNQVYRLKMWVKMDSYKQTRGAIRIASSNFINFPWGIDGDWKNICAIEDLADGQWHELTYTFYSTGNFLSISTPGLCSIYIDEISLELIPGADSSICSSPVKAEEYIGVYPASGNTTIAADRLIQSCLRDLKPLLPARITRLLMMMTTVIMTRMKTPTTTRKSPARKRESRSFASLWEATIRTTATLFG